ncbi:MAG: hypothetical protein A6F70_09240 [Cycloclasticus sp. symbiont of Bathymodiolus heckerae]|nr:MAG: hypothetical protein A6F70_09240 [Cycloclasticus sp. symbiont of Bathymodiolus heckerae]
MKPHLPNEPIAPSQDASNQQISIEQAMQLANGHQQAGKLQEAEHLLRQILQQQPQHPFALHLLGIIAQQCNQPDLAIDLIKQAIQANSGIAFFYSNLGEISRQQGQLDESIQYAMCALELDPENPTVHSNLGITWFDKKDFEKAQACQLKALSLNPKLSTALNNLGGIHRGRKEYDQAIDYYQRAVEADPNNPEPVNNLGTTLNENDQTEESIAPLNKALALNPSSADAVCNMGLSLNTLERYDEAITLFDKALSMREAYATAYIGLAKALQEKNELSKAEAEIQKALSIEPDNIDALNGAGNIYSRMGHVTEAHGYYDRILSIDPENSQALLGKGHLEMEEGHLQRAEELFNQSLSLGDDKLSARFNLIQIKKTAEIDENVKALLAEHDKNETLSIRKRTSLNYALGKCFDDLKDHDRAFPYFLEGSQLKRSTLNYDATSNAAVFDQIIEIINPDFIEKLKGHSNSSDAPIFIVGVPRSGTTLTEQIIASHPDVFGAGELYDLMDVFQQSTQANTDSHFPSNLKALTPDTAKQWVDDYINRLTERAPQAKHITDKMPANFIAIGLIHALLPNAKIIHVKRNPVDTCLSCFTRLFHHGQEQTYDLKELGQYYLNYLKIMDHWRTILPDTAFLDVQYEDIVADNKHQAKRLIDFCGLEWDDACLDFHKTKRPIKTASVTQVRQPIYSSSVERWRHYEKHLGPLIRVLDGLV